MILNIILLIVGFILLIKGADLFVDGASSTAQNFKVSKMLIGLTIIAFGTSAPEFAVSMQALAKGSTDMVLGNVIGSNILNILLILGIAAVIHPIKIKDNTVKKELPLCLLISTLVVVLFLDIKLANGIVNEITRSDAIVILLFFTVFIYYLISLVRQKRESNEEEKPKFKLGKSLLLVVVGLVGIILGSDFVVNNASEIAIKLGLSERIISLTIIAFGTSLPELVTTIVSSKKGEQDLLLGNIIGSNIFNIGVVIGLPAFFINNVSAASFNYIDMLTMIISAVILYLFTLKDHKLRKREGILMLLMFVIYYSYVVIGGLK